MAYIDTGVHMPGMAGLMFYKGPTGKAIFNMANTLLNGPSGLTSGEREMIAAHVSKLNECGYCYNIHAAVADEHLSDNGHTMSCVIENLDDAPISEKMKALLRIAGKVQKGGQYVTEQDVLKAKTAGATDEDVHDSVLVASFFCMANRYVDGLGTRIADQEEKKESVQMILRIGYRYPPLFLRKLVVRMINRKAAKQNKPTC